MVASELSKKIEEEIPWGTTKSRAEFVAELDAIQAEVEFSVVLESPELIVMKSEVVAKQAKKAKKSKDDKGEVADTEDVVIFAHVTDQPHLTHLCNNSTLLLKLSGQPNMPSIAGQNRVIVFLAPTGSDNYTFCRSGSIRNSMGSAQSLSFHIILEYEVPQENNIAPRKCRKNRFGFTMCSWEAPKLEATSDAAIPTADDAVAAVERARSDLAAAVDSAPASPEALAQRANDLSRELIANHYNLDSVGGVFTGAQALYLQVWWSNITKEAAREIAMSAVKEIGVLDRSNVHKVRLLEPTEDFTDSLMALLGSGVIRELDYSTLRADPPLIKDGVIGALSAALSAPTSALEIFRATCIVMTLRVQHCLFTAIAESRTLRELNLGNDRLEGPGIKQLAETLRLPDSCPNLAVLNLNGNKLDDEACEALCETLMHHRPKALNELDISEARATDGKLRDRAAKVLVDLLKSPMCPTDMLNMLRTGMGKKAVPQLIAAISETSCHGIGLTVGTFEDEFIAAVRKNNNIIRFESSDIRKVGTAKMLEILNPRRAQKSD